MGSHGITILHVEDDPNDVLLVARAFRKAETGAQLQVVNDGDQAVEYLSGANSFAQRDKYPLPALVLLDLKLPRKSGVEVLQWIRAQPMLKRIPVVMLTASRQTVDVNRAYDSGANAYLVKPVNFDALVEMLRTLDSFWIRSNEQPTPA